MSAEDHTATEVPPLPEGWKSGRNNSPPYSSSSLGVTAVWTRAEVDALAGVEVQQPEGGGGRGFPSSGNWSGQAGGYDNEYYELYANRSTGAVVGSREQMLALKELYERSPEVEKEAKAHVKAQQQIMGSTYLAVLAGFAMFGSIGLLAHLAIGYALLLVLGGTAVFGVGGFLASKAIINKGLEAKLVELRAMQIPSPEKQHIASADLDRRASVSAKNPEASVTQKTSARLGAGEGNAASHVEISSTTSRQSASR